ncbi:thioredoxin family protein [Ravibacter arvi]|uniref:Thioredoxin family protein n=1 Tax=Ravibacter arvi TaxID=2051041 RepID=A0ABP8M0E2_9BACT
MNTPVLPALFAAGNLNATYSYDTYMELMETVVRENRTTGPKQSPDYAAYTRLNLARMQRLNKTAVLDEDTIQLVNIIQSPQKWFVLTEAWCGDAAQCVPVIAKIAAVNPAISLTLMLRDENPEVMNQYLTNGGKSIPKLIVLDQDGNERFTWGPRPAGAQLIYDDYKQNPGRPFSELTEDLQRWYNADKTHSIQRELCEGIKKSL